MAFTKFKDLHYYVGGILILAFALYFLFTRTNQNNSGKENSTIIYLAGHITNAHQIVIDNFNKLQKGKIIVKTVNLSFKKFSTDEKKELFARFLRSESDKIDIFLIDQIWVPRFAKWSEPLEKHFSYSARQTLMPAGLESCSDGKHLVAIPLFLDIAMMYYREDLLREFTDYSSVKKKIDNSITWEDFIKLGEILKKNGKPFYTFQGKAYEGLMCSFIELMASQNMTLYKNRKLQLNTPEARRALQLLVDLVHKYKLSSSRVMEFEENQSYDYFVENDGFFLRGWPNLGWHFKPDSTEAVRISNMRKTLLPHFAGQRKTSILGGWNMMVSKFSKHKPEAIQFIKYWIGTEAQKIMYEVGGFLPVNINLYDDDAFVKKHPELLLYKEIIPKGFHRPFLRDYTKISGIISGFVNQALAGKLSVNEALRLAENKINSDLLIIQ